jgi:hypothetical protein
MKLRDRAASAAQLRIHSRSLAESAGCMSLTVAQSNEYYAATE